MASNKGQTISNAALVALPPLAQAIETVLGKPGLLAGLLSYRPLVEQFIPAARGFDLSRAFDNPDGIFKMFRDVEAEYRRLTDNGGVQGLSTENIGEDGSNRPIGERENLPLETAD